MSDMDLNTRDKNFSQNQNTGSSQDLKEQVADAGAEIKQRAGDVLRASTDTAREKFKEAADAAKEAAAGAADRFQDQAREQQRSGADFVGRFAGNIRDAARAFENDVPFAARGIEFGGRICRRGRRKNPQRKLPRSRRWRDGFCQAAACGFSGFVGARRFRRCPLPEGIGKPELFKPGLFRSRLVIIGYVILLQPIVILQRGFLQR